MFVTGGSSMRGPLLLFQYSLAWVMILCPIPPYPPPQVTARRCCCRPCSFVMVWQCLFTRSNQWSVLLLARWKERFHTGRRGGVPSIAEDVPERVYNFMGNTQEYDLPIESRTNSGSILRKSQVWTTISCEEAQVFPFDTVRPNSFLKSGNVIVFFFITLLHLPPLRIHCVGWCWHSVWTKRHSADTQQCCGSGPVWIRIK